MGICVNCHKEVVAIITNSNNLSNINDPLQPVARLPVQYLLTNFVNAVVSLLAVVSTLSVHIKCR